MKCSSFRASLWFSIGALSASFAAAKGGIEWLDRLSHSHRELNYHGVFVYEREGQIQTLRIVHGVVGDQEFERLEYLDGDHRRIERRGHNLNCLHPGHQLVRLYSQRGQQPGTNLQQYYQFDEVGEERVADRVAVTLAIQPKDIYRFGYRLSFDRDTGLLLRSELIDGNGRVLERFQYAQLSIGAISQDEFNTSTAGYEAGHGDPQPLGLPAAIPADRLPGWIPAGFALAQPVTDLQRDGLTYTDGLAAFSVFLEARPADTDAVEAAVREGATVAYSLPQDRHIVTVVGEIPRLTAERVARSLPLASAP